MPCTVIVGTQFGDEGKGKVVDYYSGDVDIIVRYNGGANAGHTVVTGKNKFAFRLLPSGVLRKDKTVIIGNGVVLDPEILLSEIKNLKDRGITPAQILISNRAHVVMPYHKQLDALEEKFKGHLRAGTTKRGIGPCYSDKVARFGIRVCDLLDEEALNDKINALVPLKEKELAMYGETVQLSKANLLSKYLEYGNRLSPYVTNTIRFLKDAVLKNKTILFEGAQGTLLDIDYGVYPFGTSSNTVSGGACTGSGMPPTKIDKVIGVVKAYTSRVGEGPFPTELKDTIGQHLREKGVEYGTVTKRPRRCGWLDIVMVNYSILVNGISSIALTKIDVLGGLKQVKVCVAYEYRGKEARDFPANTRILSKCKPIYHVLPGWEDYSQDEWFNFVNEGFATLPSNVKQYIEYIEEASGTSVNLLSFGPERDLTLIT